MLITRFFTLTTLANILLISVPLTYSVDVVITCEYNNRSAIQYCPNLPPGQCCRAITQCDVAEVRHLSALQFAATWHSRNATGGCSGPASDVRWGPGTASMPSAGKPRPGISGASYISIPPRPPKGIEAQTPLLDAEGILGFVWSSGRWFTGKAKMLGIGHSKSTKRSAKEKRDVLPQYRSVINPYADNGTLYWESPSSWRYPDVIEADDIAFQLIMNGSEADYRDANGMILDLDLPELGD